MLILSGSEKGASNTIDLTQETFDRQATRDLVVPVQGVLTPLVILSYPAGVHELRSAFHKRLEIIEGRVIQLFPLVSEDLALATQALVGGSSDALRVVTDREQRMDAIYAELDDLVNEEIALESPVAAELRLLLSILRVLPELERSHDLVVQIAELATHTLGQNISPRAVGLVQQMGDTGATMWDEAKYAWIQRDAAAAEVVEDRNDEVESLHASLMAELASGAMTLPVTMDMTLVARFYERLGDHARNIARRVPYLAGHESEG
jgi:phosphate transport system protein